MDTKKKNMKTFEEYLEHLREKVKREPKDDVERGFQMAVVLIHNDYNVKKSIDENLENWKSKRLKEMKKDIETGRFEELIKTLPNNE